MPKSTTNQEDGLAVTNQHSWLRATLPVALIALFAELGYAVLNNSTLPVYFKDGLGIDPALIGPIMMPFFFSELFKGPLGVLADKIGRKPLMIVGPSISILTPLVFTFIHCPPGRVALGTLIGFGFLRLLDGLGASALWPATFAYLGDVVRSNKRASAMSVLNVTYMFGLALGFLSGGIVDDTFGPILSGRVTWQQETNNIAPWLGHVGPNATSPSNTYTFGGSRKAPRPSADSHNQVTYFPSFYLTSLLFFLATICAITGVRSLGPTTARGSPTVDEPSGNAELRNVTWRSIIETISAVPGVLLLAFVTFFGIGCIALQVKIFALDEFGISETQFGLIFLWPALIIGALAIPLGHMADQWGRVHSIRLGFFIAALSLWTMIALVHNTHLGISGLAISGTVLGLGFVIAFPAWLAYLTTLTDDSHRGTVIGAASTAQALGVLLGTLLGGWLYKHWSPNATDSHIAPFVACALFLACGSLLSTVVLHASPRKLAAS